MADTLLDDSERMTYTAKLGRKLHPDNAGAMQYGPRYMDFHRRAWMEARRVLQPGGAFILNIKDFVRDGLVMHVTQWHIGCLESLGFRLLCHERIDTPSMRFGKNGEVRVRYESVILFELEVP